MSYELRPLPGEWYWGIMCPGCHRHCLMYRDITQATVELTARPGDHNLERMVGLCEHCHERFDVTADQFHHFQIPASFYDS